MIELGWVTIPPLGALNVALVAFFSSVVFVFWVIIDGHRAGLSHVPGPFFARYTDLDGLYRKWSVGLHGDWLSPLHHKYGDVVRIGPRSVSVADPAAIRPIYNTKDRLNKSFRWNVFKPSGINPPYGSMRDMADHGTHRRPVAGAYAPGALRRYEPLVDQNIESLLEALGKASFGGEKEVDIARWAYYYAYDLIGFITFGEPIGFIKEGRDMHYLITTQLSMLYYFRTIIQLPILGYLGICNPLLGMLGLNKKFAFYNYAQGQVKKRYDSESCTDYDENPDMLSYFLAAREKHPDILTREEIMTNCFVNMAAGSLSQSKVLEEILRFLVRVPAAQETIFAEIISFGVKAPVSNKDAQALPYLNAVIREGLRLHHSGFGMIVGRDTSKEGLTLPNGVFLPGGVEVGMEPRVLGSREDTYHEAPLTFRPERWLPLPNESDEKYQKRRTAMEHTDLSFGYGSSACIGRFVVMMSMHKLIANLTLRYKLVPTGHVGADDDYSVFCTLEAR